MAYDSRMYLDPARLVKYEAERQPCHGCKYAGILFDMRFCTHGMEMRFGCKKYSKEKVAP